jgi:hypothetical protein
MKKNLQQNLILIVLFSSICFSAQAQTKTPDPKQKCEQFIQSFMSIGKQLRHSPDLSAEQLKTIFSNYTEDAKLKNFMNQFLIPKTLKKNSNELDLYVSSGAAQSQCYSLVSSPY